MKSLFFALAMLISSMSFAAEGIVVHTLEIGVGKFHRADNKVHVYAADNAWTPYILPENAPTDKNTVQKNADGSYTVFYVTLQDMMNSVAAISKETNQKVSVLNVHGHGLPGAMWFPKDQEELNSDECSDWVEAANGSDEANYNQYYSAISKNEIEELKYISNSLNFHMGCTTGAKEWKEILAKVPEFKAAIASDAQIHFLSCVVGMGKVGDAFTKGVAEALLSKDGTGRVVTSLEFGLGDWSMPEGMGFWNYQNDAQLDRDNTNYLAHKQDREMAQKGSMRIASLDSNKIWDSKVLKEQQFMLLGFDKNAPQGEEVSSEETDSMMSSKLLYTPFAVRIPGTTYFAPVNHR